MQDHLRDWLGDNAFFQYGLALSPREIQLILLKLSNTTFIYNICAEFFYGITLNVCRSKFVEREVQMLLKLYRPQ